MSQAQDFLDSVSRMGSSETMGYVNLHRPDDDPEPLVRGNFDDSHQMTGLWVHLGQLLPPEPTPHDTRVRIGVPGGEIGTSYEVGVSRAPDRKLYLHFDDGGIVLLDGDANTATVAESLDVGLALLEPIGVPEVRAIEAAIGALNQAVEDAFEADQLGEEDYLGLRGVLDLLDGVHRDIAPGTTKRYEVLDTVDQGSTRILRRVKDSKAARIVGGAFARAGLQRLAEHAFDLVGL